MDMNSKNYVRDVFPGYGEPTNDLECAKAVQMVIDTLSAPKPEHLDWEWEADMQSAANNFYSIKRYDLKNLMQAIVTGATETNRLRKLEDMKAFQSRYITAS
jgi:hypothetical protein